MERHIRSERTRGALLLVGMLVALTACTATGTDPEAPAQTAGETSVTQPPTDGVPDYQLGGAYAPEPDVRIVARDRESAPDADRYSICYVNGFQTQPSELDLWPEDTLLRTADGPVFDPDWPDEALLDTSTASSRERILALVGPWIRGCAEAGFDAVEFDNLDTYTRSHGALTQDDNVALAARYVDIAHQAGLAAAQKNAAEDAAQLRTNAGFDFAVTEECAAFRECTAYTDVYGAAVIDIEYADALPRTFAEMCADSETPRSVVLRDRDLTRPGDPAYVFQTCS